MQKNRTRMSIITLLFALIMMFGIVSANTGIAYADGPNSTTVYKNGVDGSEWYRYKNTYGYIDTVVISGVGVEDYVWEDANTCSVVLDSSTAPDATVTFTTTAAGAGGNNLYKQFCELYNGSASATGQTTSGSVTMSGGEATMTIQPRHSSASSWTGTKKTFNITTSDGVVQTFDVTLNSGTGYTVSAVGDSVSPVEKKGSFTFQIDIAEGYKKGAYFAVKVNGEEVELDSNNQYTINNIREAKNVTVEDVVTSDTVNQYDITLTPAEGVTYVPVDGSASPIDEGSDYKFRVELATGYMASGSFAVKDNDTALTADGNGVYILPNVNAHHTITVTGVTHLASVTAPTGSTVKAGYENGEWTYYWYDPVVTDNNGDGTTVYYFNPVTSGRPFFRVQNPNGVTYWNFESMAAGKGYTVTMDDLTKNGTFAPDTIYHDFYYNYLDLGDIYLTVNEKNYLSLAKGGNKVLNAFRNWEAINSFTNDMIALPDFHYEVVDIDGNPSDLVTVTTDTNNSGRFTLNASSSDSGLAIVKVTYDAMIHMDGYASGYGAGGADTTRLGAIWPECTGIIVVTVGQSGTLPGLGMTINTEAPLIHAGKVADNNIDAEHDLLYYYGDEGAEYSFTPESGAAVSVARCTLGEHDLSFNGFTTDGVTTDNGKVTVTGLTAGRHIVKVEKDGVANYQVLSARHITLDVRDASDNVISDWETRIFAPGDTLTVKMHNVNCPQEKLAQCYNCSFGIAYFDEQGTKMASTKNADHQYGQYNFSSMDQTVTVAIPDNWTAKHTYELKGAVELAGGFTGTAGGGHRSKNYGGASGGATGTASGGVYGVLPTLKFNVNSAPYVIKGLTNPVTASVAAGEDYLLDMTQVFTDDNGDDLTYTVSIDGADPVAADENYSVSFDEAGIYNLVFQANDGIADSADTYRVRLKVGVENRVPNRKDGIAATSNITINQGEAYELDLSEIFEDADEDDLSFEVSVNDAAMTAAQTNFTYTPDSSATTKLLFKANDGTVDSTDTYTVALKVAEGSDPCTYWDSNKDGTGWNARGASYSRIELVKSSGVSVKNFKWTDATTCDVTLIQGTDENASFDFIVNNYVNSTSRGVIINGTNYPGTARATKENTVSVSLNNGQTSVTVQPYYTTSDIRGTEKTFNFHIEQLKDELNANAVLQNDITMKLHANFPDEQPDDDSATMLITMNDEITIINGVKENDTKYLFNYTDISPENINDDFTAELSYKIDGETFIHTLENYSIRKYCEYVLRHTVQLPATATLDEIRTLMVDTLFYGAEAQKYVGYKTDALATADLTDDEIAMATAYVSPTAADGVITERLTGTKNDNYNWVSAQAVLDKAARLRLYFEAPNGIDGLKVIAGNKEFAGDQIQTRSGKYYIEISDIAADTFGDQIDASFEVNGQATGQTVHYNINTYVSQTENHATFGPLAQRLFNYGKSSKAYVTPAA